MQLMPQGDHYVWYCDWCDTRNLTHWVRVERDEVCCAACQRKYPVMENPRQTKGKRPSYYQIL
ncbi:hypothetical protein [Citrifermentans bremense]|uniref:hypothetical protein n=1 Tax=Citrifermentans bremense TaxID=60035 RepID=UPI00041911DB|nr:hypothetical protein [Citrifermentans bremense]